MKSVEIFFNDLLPEKQKEFLETVGANEAKDMNWDMNICPLAIVDFEEEIMEENN